jgi:hypothetical protein
LTIPTKGPVPTPEKPSNCKTHSAEICKTTTSYDGVVESGTTKTTSSTIKETCATIYGCEVQDDVTGTETISVCTKANALKPREPPAEATAPPTLQIRAPPNPEPCGPVGDVVIFPANPADIGLIRTYLSSKTNSETGRVYWDDTVQIGSRRIAFTAFFYVHGFTQFDAHHLYADRDKWGVSFKMTRFS